MAKLTDLTKKCLRVHEFVTQYMNFRLLGLVSPDLEENLAAGRLDFICSTRMPHSEWIVTNARWFTIAVIKDMDKNSLNLDPRYQATSKYPSVRDLDLIDRRMRLHEAMKVISQPRCIVLSFFLLLEWGVSEMIVHMKRFPNPQAHHIIGLICETIVQYPIRPNFTLHHWMELNKFWECQSCGREFGEQGKKHHCRGCGQGFCDECTQFSKPVPQKGWWPNPVRVCEKCYNLPTGTISLGAERDVGEANSLMPRQIVENVQSVLGGVSSVAIDYPIEMIKDSARPFYWVPDHLIKDCHICQAEFGPKLAIHHCGACGHGVCRNCSDSKRQVPSKGWDKPVRVCDTCFKKEGMS